MNFNDLKNVLNKRKGLVISIVFHILIIIAIIIFLSFFKTGKKEPQIIKEIELFTPPEETLEKQPAQPEPDTAKKEKIIEDIPEEQKTELKRKRPAPEPFKPRLKNSVIEQWDSIEKKNLQNQ